MAKRWESMEAIWSTRMSELFDKKDVFSWSNCEEARQYIGDEGYFCDEWREDLGTWHKGLLQDIDRSMTVDCIFENEKNEVFGLFLPADRVKHPEKKWRPFKDSCEFIRTVGRDVGDSLVIRRKNLPAEIVHIVLVTEFHRDLNTIGLGTCTYSYKELYDNYAWRNKEFKWQPFGVCENE